MKNLLTIYLTLTILLSATVTASFAGSISGNVSYNGSVEGSHTIYIVAMRNVDPPDEPPAAQTELSLPGGNYTLTDIGDGNYFVFAFLDADDSGPEPGQGDPRAMFDQDDDGFPNPVEIIGGAQINGIDILLEDKASGGAIEGIITDAETTLPIANLVVEALNYDTEQWAGNGCTDANGYYSITGLPSGDYRVETCADCTGLNYMNEFFDGKIDWNQADRVPVTAPDITSGIDFALETSGAIAGTVTDSNGYPITDIRVEVQDYDSGEWKGDSQTDANGVYIITGLPSGDYRVSTCAQCSQQDYVDEFFNNKTDWSLADRVTVTAPETTDNVNFTLGQGTFISGYVYGWDTNTSDYIILEGAHISVENYSGGGGWGGGQSDANGFYKVTGLSPGEYRVRAEKYPYIEKYYVDAIDWSEAEAVTINTETPATDIDFNLDLGSQISGYILDADTNQPITNGWVNACPVNGEPWGRGTDQIDSNGFYILSGLPTGSYKLSARADGYDEEFYENQVDWMFATEIQVVTGQITEGINFTLKKETGGIMVGRVVLPDGNGVPDAHICADSMEHMKWKNANTDPNGDFTLTGIIPGQWKLRVEPPWGELYRDFSEIDNVIVNVPEGQEITDVGTLTLATINLIGQVQMPDGSPARNVPVMIEKTDWSFCAGTSTDQDGYFRKGGLEIGEYKLRIELPWGVSGIVPPDPNVFEITNVNEILDLGITKYKQAAKHISGRVEHKNQSGVPNVEVNAWRRGAEGWARTETDPNGNFTLDVAAGTWEMMIHPSPQSTGNIDWFYLGHPKVVTFAKDPNTETKNIKFTVDSATSQVTGRVVGPDEEILRQGTAWVDIRNDQGQGNGVQVIAGGSFSISVGAGTYNIWVGIDEQTYPYWSSPKIAPFQVVDNNTVDLGYIKLVEKNSSIQGQVTRSSDGEPVSGVSVHAWQHEGGWANAMTNDAGNYLLTILEGNWEIGVEPPCTSSYISGQPPIRVYVDSNEAVTGIDFVLQAANGTIEGTLRDSNGVLLTDIDGGWSYARQGVEFHEPVAGAPVENGQFTLKVPDGSYYVGVHLPPNCGYSISDEQQVTIDSAQPGGEQAEVTIEMLANDATISGGFYTDNNDLAEGLNGEVFAMQEMKGVWQCTRIKPNGTYELQVSAGTWNLGYWIDSTNYINNQPPNTKVDVNSSKTVNFDFTLIAADGSITGYVKDPNGNPLCNAWVWAHCYTDNSTDSKASNIDSGSESKAPDGSFSISVPSGYTYEVGVHAPRNWGYIQPDMQTVALTDGVTDANLVFQFKESDATISGRVYYVEDGNEINCPHAWVNAWSDDGQHTGEPTDYLGNYQLRVVTGTTWHINAVYETDGGSEFYQTPSETAIAVATSQIMADLEVQLDDRTLPAPVSATFDPSVGWTHTLENGTKIEIPGGAIPTTDTVYISFTPMIEELQDTATDKPVGFGYSISIYEESTGNKITQNFNTNVLMTFYYTDEDLEDIGITEDDILPAYFSTTTNSWTKVESFTVDKEANKVTVQINHFSLWALTGAPGQAGDSPVGDINGDNNVDYEDLIILASQWLQPPSEPSADIAPQGSPDGIVNFLDFAVLAGNWSPN